MKIFFFALLLGLFQLSAYAQSTALFKRYLQDAMDTKLSSLALADKYFCTTQLHQAGPDGEWGRQMTDMWLSEQRKELRDKQLRLDAVKFVPYDSLTVAEQPAKPFHMMDETSHTYVALYRGKIACYFLLRDNRISSTLLLGMGEEHTFIDYCAKQ